MDTATRDEILSETTHVWWSLRVGDITRSEAMRLVRDIERRAGVERWCGWCQTSHAPSGETATRGDGPGRFVPTYPKTDNPWAETESAKHDARMAEDWRM